jgi:hypothetical protein
MLVPAIELMRHAAEFIRTTTPKQLQDPGNMTFLIPDYDEAETPYPLGLQPGMYALAEVADAVRWLADMLEE